MKISVINGPNINMLGTREKSIYGDKTYNDLVCMIKEKCNNENIQVDCFQSNHEGNIVDKIQDCFNNCDAIIINPAAYTHTSIAILDALKAVNIPCVEVHISNVDQREEFRKISYIREYCKKTISGHGFDGYIMAIDYLKKELAN